MKTPTEPFLVNVTRDEFLAFVRDHVDRSEPVEGSTVAAMYHYDAKGNLIAIAFYTRTLAPYVAQRVEGGVDASYRIRKTPVQEGAC